MFFVSKIFIRYSLGVKIFRFEIYLGKLFYVVKRNCIQNTNPKKVFHPDLDPVCPQENKTTKPILKKYPMYDKSSEDIISMYSIITS